MRGWGWILPQERLSPLRAVADQSGRVEERLLSAAPLRLLPSPVLTFQRKRSEHQRSARCHPQSPHNRVVRGLPQKLNDRHVQSTVDPADRTGQRTIECEDTCRYTEQSAPDPEQPQKQHHAPPSLISGSQAGSTISPGHESTGPLDGDSSFRQEGLSLRQLPYGGSCRNLDDPVAQIEPVKAPHRVKEKIRHVSKPVMIDHGRRVEAHCQ